MNAQRGTYAQQHHLQLDLLLNLPHHFHIRTQQSHKVLTGQTTFCWWLQGHDDMLNGHPHLAKGCIWRQPVTAAAAAWFSCVQRQLHTCTST